MALNALNLKCNHLAI